VPNFGVPRRVLNLPLSSADTVVNAPPTTVPCELVLGAKSPYMPVFRLNNVVDLVFAAANVNTLGVVQTSTTNRCATMLLVGGFHVALYVQSGEVVVPALYTEAPVKAASAVKGSPVPLEVLWVFAENQQSWFVVASNIRV